MWRTPVLASLSAGWLKARATFAGFVFFDAQAQANVLSQITFAGDQIAKLSPGGDWDTLDDVRWTKLANECGRGIADVQNQMDDGSGLVRIWKEIVVPTAQAIPPAVEGITTAAVVIGVLLIVRELRKK